MVFVTFLKSEYLSYTCVFLGASFYTHSGTRFTWTNNICEKNKLRDCPWRKKMMPLGRLTQWRICYYHLTAKILIFKHGPYQHNSLHLSMCVWWKAILNGHTLGANETSLPWILSCKYARCCPFSVKSIFPMLCTVTANANFIRHSLVDNEVAVSTNNYIHIYSLDVHLYL